MTEVTVNRCHILPCSIDEDMTSHTARYFHPTILENATPADDNASINAAKDNRIMMAAQFRGRGLLCVADDANQETDDTSVEIASTLPEGMKGVVLAPSTSHAKNTLDVDKSRSLKVIETFHQVYKWQHEHDAGKVKRSMDEAGDDKVGLKAVLGWCEVAHAVHDPIPLPPSK